MSDTTRLTGNRPESISGETRSITTRVLPSACSCIFCSFVDTRLVGWAVRAPESGQIRWVQAYTCDRVGTLQAFESLSTGGARGQPAFGMVYTPAAGRREQDVPAACRYPVSCHIHLRGGSTGTTSEPEAEAVLVAAVVKGAPLQMVHINSTSHNRAPQMLQILREACARRRAWVYLCVFV